ncbi:MAG: BA14K family protein [Rhodospirillaceae bacterium]|nr:BA14K family protein [Rhodospirillaceae bacterium]
MKIRSFGLGASALAIVLSLGAAPAFAEGAAAGGNESAAGENRFTPRGRDVGDDRAAIPQRDRSIRADPSYDRRRFDGRSFDRSRYSDRFERRGDFAYYNGHRGYRYRRDGYREHNGFWFPLAAFAAGALIAGAAQPAPVVVAPNPHVDWCRRTYRSYNPYDNTFQPYHGPRAYCISPYS